MAKERKNIILFGYGKEGKKFFQEAKSNTRIYRDVIIAITDNNKEIWHTKEGKINIICPDNISRIEYDKIVIASKYEGEIYQQLIENRIDPTKIIFLDRYKREVYSLYQYRKRYNYNFYTGMQTFQPPYVVYTSITGDYDTLNEPEFVDDEMDYICFTNNKNLRSRVWKMIYIENNGMDNMHLAKRVKIFPEEYLFGYKTSIWVDGKFKIKDDLRQYVTKYERDADILCFPHFARDCIYDEAAVCMMLYPELKNQILTQITDYFKKGYKINNGLYEMGCIVRKFDEPQVKKIMYMWWQEILKYSYRDQISFPYVCMNNDFIPDICDLDINDNKWLEMVRKW